ncbi:MAG TPA: right-handed parallel beta-helix repeat-containing protein, partial [Solirubrobacteraceae bacterium]|nr:right-handed parallel beta-helix repeat-containing protein [Solirubrobacteraceae bacterium]
MFVVAGATLTIEPGVTVDFNAGEGTTLYVKGTILSLGSASSPVVFTSSQALLGGGVPGQYKGLEVESGNASSVFSYTGFYYGAKGSGGLYGYGELKIIKGSTVLIEHSTFENNAYTGVKLSDTSIANVAYSEFTNNGGGLAASTEAVMNVSHSTITKNTEDGVFWNTLSEKEAGSSFTYNTIAENGNIGVDIVEECKRPVSTFPHGEYNNIYSNGGTKEADKQVSPLVCKSGPLPVDWENNYWGSEVYYYHNSKECGETATPYPG